MNAAPDGATAGEPVAIIDCGTNTIRLLITAADGHGGLLEQDRRMEIVRLGQGVDATGAFHRDALNRTFAAAERYAEVIDRHHIGPQRTRFVATSASRDVSNRDEFFAGITARLGVSPDVISGQEEARLSFTGALSSAELAASSQTVLVTDIGGGSTELIIGDSATGPRSAISLDVGSVRITERFFHEDPPPAEDLAVATEHIDRLLADSGIDWPSVHTWIGVAGTITTLAAVDLDLVEYDRSVVDGHRIAREQVGALADELAGLSSEQIRGRNGVHPQRADVITAGALIAARIADRLSVPQLRVSEADILDGAALELLQQLAR